MHEVLETVEYYTCRYCNTSFTLKSDLLEHQGKNHRETESGEVDTLENIHASLQGGMS